VYLAINIDKSVLYDEHLLSALIWSSGMQKHYNITAPIVVRNDWTREEASQLYHTRLLNLIYQAASVHRQFHKPEDIQQCTLLSIKTGACPEDCSYCPQSSRYKTDVEPEPLLNVDAVTAAARIAKEAGSTRFCMGAAWREVQDNAAFEQVLQMVEFGSLLHSWHGHP
jgi:biotin synthase